MKLSVLALFIGVQLTAASTFVSAQIGSPNAQIQQQILQQYEINMLEKLIPRHPADAMRIINGVLAAQPQPLTPVQPAVVPKAPELATSQNQTKPTLATAVVPGSTSTALSAAVSITPTAVQSPSAVPADPEQVLKQRLTDLPTTTQSLQVESYPDGFSVNGVRHIDPEGQIVQYRYDMLTGNITYLVRQSPQQMVIKFIRAGVANEPLLLARAVYSGDGWLVATQTGKTLKGDYLVMASLGFLVARFDSAFFYQPGENLRNVATPKGYVIARHQNGDVAGTGYLLLERPPASPDNVGAAANSLFSALGSLVGQDHRDADYVLFNIRTGNKVDLNIASDGKEIAIGRNCRAQNILVNICQKMQTYESLYDRMGLQNITHYYWRIRWYATVKGPLAVTLENGLKEVRIRDLESGKRAVAFERALGVSGLYSSQNNEGRVSVTARLLLTNNVLEDARDWLDRQP